MNQNVMKYKQWHYNIYSYKIRREKKEKSQAYSNLHYFFSVLYQFKLTIFSHNTQYANINLHYFDVITSHLVLYIFHMYIIIF